MKFGRFSLDLSAKTLVMGILNVTPDSFSDGGRFSDLDRALRQAERMAREGADIIDIGGESTRPGAAAVSADEESRRVLPVIEELARRLPLPLSIDTRNAETARRALEAGASMLNDVSGLRHDPETARTAAAFGVPVAVMHIEGNPKDMQDDPRYDDLFGEITDYLAESIAIAVAAGVAHDMIIVDPGIGFGKTLDHNLLIIKGLEKFKSLCKPILVGVSRKSFIGRVLGGLPAGERLIGSAAAAALCVLNGASIIRAHDVKETVEAVKIADAVRRAS
jgi:dihydropteroate synthase